MLKQSNKLLAIAALVCLGACATTSTSTIQQSAGKLTLADSHIGEDYNDVLARATSMYKMEPQCENRKVGLKNSRKAFLYGACGYNPQNARFADAPMAEVTYHFIDNRLVRVDVRAEGEQALLDQVKDDMQSVFASRDAQFSELDAQSYEWVAPKHIAGVRMGTGASVGNVHVRLFDQSLADSAPWLTLE